MKSLVIGGAGFVGTYLIKHLRDDLAQEVVVTKMPMEQIVEPQVKVCDLDILEPQAIVRLLQEEQPDYVFHLAAQSSVALSWKNPQLTIDVNIKGVANVLEALRTVEKKPRVLLIGSGEEYGYILPEETPIQETNALRPGNIYAATKACQNMLGQIYARAYDLDIMMVRAFTHVGPNQSPMFVVSDFCKQVAEIEAGKKEPVMHVGNLSAKRDFTDVRDVVRAYGMLIQKGQKGETYNIGSGHSIEIRELLEKIVANSDKKIDVVVEKSRLRPVDVPEIVADTAKVFACSEWRAQIPIEQTIQETLDYWRRNV